MSHSRSDPAALRRRRAFRLVYRTGIRILPRLLSRLGVPLRDAKDMEQDVLIAAYRSLDGFDPFRSGGPESEEGTEPDSAGTDPAEDPAARWLYGISWRQARHYHERAYRRAELPSGLLEPGIADETVAAHAHAPDARLERVERRAVVLRALRQVRPERRVLLILCDALEVPVPRAAARLRLKLGTAHDRLKRGREDLRKIIERMSPDERNALRSLPAPFAALLRAAWESNAADPPASAALPSVRPAGLRMTLAAFAAAATLMLPAAWPGRAAAEPPAGSPTAAHRDREPGRSARVPGSAGAAPAHAPSSGKDEAPRAGSASNASPARQVDPASASATAGARRSHPEQDARDPLEEERRLLVAARAALVRGDPASARAFLAEHERRFPSGRLGALRGQLCVRASMVSHPGAEDEHAMTGRSP